MVCCGSALSLLPKRDLCLLPIIAHRQSLLVANLCRSSINNSPSSATSLACRWMYQWWMGTVWMGLVWGFGWVCFCGGPVVLDGYGLDGYGLWLVGIDGARQRFWWGWDRGEWLMGFMVAIVLVHIGVRLGYGGGVRICRLWVALMVILVDGWRRGWWVKTLDIFFFFSAVVCGCSRSGWWLVAAMVGGCGDCDMDGWIWWPAVLGWERERQRKERQREEE